jgi:hypothetical protein
LWFVSLGAQQRSNNFIVETPDPNFARQVVQAAEQFRHDLAVEWTGEAMPNWAHPCVMTVQAAPQLGAGGATTFVFDRGEVFDWRMTIQGSRERILDSVLPHEITHMIFASHFRQPLPRWADEGGATSVEHISERSKQRQMLDQFLRTGRGIAFSQMFAMTEYPVDIMPLYAQGYSLAEFLIGASGRRKYVEFLGDGLQNNDWSGAIQRHYAIQDLGVLQNTWLAWVKEAPGVMLASNEQRRPLPAPNLIYRVRDKESPAVPLAAMVPISATASSVPAERVSNVKPVRTASTSLQWVGPKPAPAERAAVVDLRSGSVSSVKTASVQGLPGPVVEEEASRTPQPAGWHSSGDATVSSTVPSSPSNSSATQVSHSQAWELPRQTILR